MKHSLFFNLAFLLFALTIAYSCNPQNQQEQQETAPQAYNTTSQRVAGGEKPQKGEEAPQLVDKAETDEGGSPADASYEWQVDLLWYANKTIGGSGPFPLVDTITLYMEDANVSIYWPKKPDIKVIQKQAQPPVQGYKLLGSQGEPRLIAKIRQ